MGDFVRAAKVRISSDGETLGVWGGLQRRLAVVADGLSPCDEEDNKTHTSLATPHWALYRKCFHSSSQL